MQIDLEKFTITDYEVLAASTTARLGRAVRDRLAEGWLPVGGIALLPSAGNPDDPEDSRDMVFYLQAMVAVEPND